MFNTIRFKLIEIKVKKLISKRTDNEPKMTPMTISLSFISLTNCSSNLKKINPSKKKQNLS